MGMTHDGENGCNDSCCIMSTSTGPGRTLWSPCSARELDHFIAELDKRSVTGNCLRTTNIRHKRMPKILSGQMYTLDEQCMLFHGICWKHEIRHNEHISDVCKMIWCGNGEGVIRSAHPALEYSHCGHHMWCIEGQCKRAVQEVAVKLRHGGWSDWTVSGRGGCATQCVPCQISGQIRVRRSIRICNSPYPNNGGSYCVGDDARGIRCQKNKCDGPTIEEFATKSCTQLRDSGDPSTTNLTGKGMQHSSNRCKIWCFLSNGLIRTAAIFPDGTPCGIDQYCVKGRCRKLSCDGRGIVEFSSHCPRRNEMEQNGSVRLAQKHVKIVMNNSINQTVERKRFMKLRLNLQVWAEWSSWSGCTASFCGQKGFRLRRSECIKGAINRKACRMFRGQRQTCYGKCTAGDFKWTEWSACSASCDFGFEQRIRTCPTCAAEDNNKVTRVCFLKKCKNRGHWSSQNFSESCSCALRYYIRLRKCSNSSCKNKKLY